MSNPPPLIGRPTAAADSDEWAQCKKCGRHNIKRPKVGPSPKTCTTCLAGFGPSPTNDLVSRSVSVVQTEIEDAIADYKTGKSATDAAKENGVSIGALRQALHARGLMRKGKQARGPLEALARWRDQGKALRDKYVDAVDKAKARLAEAQEALAELDKELKR